MYTYFKLSIYVNCVTWGSILQQYLHKVALDLSKGEVFHLRFSWTLYSGKKS